MLDTKDSDSQHYHIYEWLSTVHVKTRKTRPVAVLACVKPLQSSPGSKGNDRKHARAPFSAVRASWKLKVDGFSSSRGALHDPHHEKTTKATTGPRPLGGDRWKPAPRCIFHHFCKCDTNLGGTARLNFRFYRFLNFWRAFFITFASVTPIPVRRRTKIFVFIIFNQNFECRPSPHTHTLSRSLGRWRFRREMYGFPMIFELGVRLRRLFMTLDGPLHS